MNTRSFPASVWLVAFGAGAILFIGAFARFDQASSTHAAATPLGAPPLALEAPPAEVKTEPPLPADLSPGLSEIIRLAQAQVDESVILAYVQNSGLTFAPTADEILYLADLGLSQEVIGAMVKTAPTTLPAPPEQQMAAAPGPPPPPEPADPAFEPPPSMMPPPPESAAAPYYDDLAAYGSWSQQADYGMVWQPTVETINTDWRPYLDDGQWFYSDSGWYWQSRYTWGWTVFHYGRWVNLPRRGWVWAPGSDWAPAWVAWRSTPTAIGWAPLPPGAGLNVLAQLTFLGQPVGPKSTLGLPGKAYTFVGTSNLTARNLSKHLVPASRVNDMVRDTVILDSYAIVNNRIFNGGVSRDAVAAARHKPVNQVALRTVSRVEEAGLVDRKTMAVYLPPAGAKTANSARREAAARSRSTTAEESPVPMETAMLAENDAAKADPWPVAPVADDVGVQLPPLHYRSPSGLNAQRRNPRSVFITGGPGSDAVHREALRGDEPTEVQRPSRPAPRVQEIYEAPHQREQPRMAVESRPPPPEPARASHAPPPVPPSGSKPGKN